MFAFAFAQPEKLRAETQLPPAAAVSPDLAPVRAIVSPLWEEHCVECAVPECYASCALYAARADGACARFVYGIAPNPHAAGLHDVGADIRFRPWAKLEAALGDGGYGLTPHAHPLPHGAPPQGARRLGDTASMLDAIARTDALRVAVFVPPGETPGALVVEAFTIADGRRRSLARQGLPLREGWNTDHIATNLLGLGRSLADAWLFVQPERPDTRLVFGWLDFVAFADTAAGRPTPVDPAPTVKVVVWDLDGTLWDGVLAEGGGGADHLRPGLHDVLSALDARGILLSVASKNDHAVAFPELERAGLADLFLYPAIHWGQKSESLKAIAARLNLGLDSFAFIDDSPHERAEVAAHLPMVRVFDAADAHALLSHPAFDVPVTELSARRRATYREAIARDAAREVFGADHEAFLASCGMRLTIAPPATDAARARCHELILRSNQLNLSGRRLAREELDALIDASDHAVYALSCEDRFGDYGLVGCAIIDQRGDWPLVRDMVVSCRVAEKRVEAAFFRWYMGRAREAGHDRVFARLVRTEKNRPMLRALEQGGFTLARAGETSLLFTAEIDAVLAERPLAAEPLTVIESPS